jgi:hypothetical protein
VEGLYARADKPSRRFAPPPVPAEAAGSPKR